jgi:CubicO group peptidase (beta-lactamase class C family)
MQKKVILVLVAVVLAAGAYGINYLRDVEAIAAGYISQTVCTNVLILGRDQAEVEAHDLTAQQRDIATSTVNDDVVETTVRIGPVSYTEYSLYRPGMGCSVLAGRSLEDVRAIALEERVERQSSSSPVTPAWPSVDRNVPDVNWEQLDSTIANTFIETTDDIEKAQNTRAVLVSYGGKLIAERYADGFDGDTPQRGMSMTKSATATLIGILVQQDRLDVNALAPIDGWSELDDGRSRVTTHHLLTMTAGFDYQENSSGAADLRNLLKTMLYSTPDAPGFAAQTPLQGEPGNSWAYQTVHSVLLQQVARNVIADDQQYFFIGGASMYASPRDWMKLGLLYLNEGVHQGERILPKGWVKYATTASEPSLKTRAYGAQIWLNTPAPYPLFPGMPEDAYAFQGHFGQYVIIVPSLGCGQNGYDLQRRARL